MKTSRLVALLITSLAFASTTQAGNIVMLRMGGGAVYPNSANDDTTHSNSWFLAYGTNNCDFAGAWTEQNQMAFTNVDETFVVALTNAGHHVTGYWVNNSDVSDSDLARLNTNDVIIVDFTPNSGSFNLSGGGFTGTGCTSTNTGDKWNTLVTAPMIVTKDILAEPTRHRMNWFTGISSNDWATYPLMTSSGSRPNGQVADFDTGNNLSTTASGRLTFVDQNNPLFVGITYTNDGSGNRVMSNYFMLDISTNVLNPGLAGNYWLPSIARPIPVANGGIDWSYYSPGDFYNRGCSIPPMKVVQSGVDQGYTNDLSPGGRILATMEFNPMTDPAATPTDGDNPPQGTAPVPDPNWVVTGYVIAEWPYPGSMAYRWCTNSSGAYIFCDNLAGYRMYLAVGTRDPNTTNLTTDDGTGGRSVGFFAGGWNLTPDGEKIFLRAVDRAILKGNLPSLSVAHNGGSVTVSWNPGVVTWKLQKSSDLAAWTDVTSGVVNNSYTPSPLGSAEYYRLAVK